MRSLISLRNNLFTKYELGAFVASWLGSSYLFDISPLVVSSSNP